MQQHISLFDTLIPAVDGDSGAHQSNAYNSRERLPLNLLVLEKCAHGLREYITTYYILDSGIREGMTQKGENKRAGRFPA